MKIKRALLRTYRFFCKQFKCCVLTEIEKQGYWRRFSWFKVFRSQGYFNYENGLTIRGVGFKNISDDPKGSAISNFFLSTQYSEDELAKTLYKHYTLEKKMSVAKILNLNLNHKTEKYPIWSLVYPWDIVPIGDKFKKYPDSLVKNRARHGLVFSSANHKDIVETAYSFEAAKAQARQFAQLLKKIQQHGYKENFSPPHILILKKGSQWKWIMGAEGNHRAYLNYFLKNSSLFAEVIGIIDVSKASRWKNVRNGLYTEKEAEEIFQLVFEGKQRTRGLI